MAYNLRALIRIPGKRRRGFRSLHNDAADAYSAPPSVDRASGAGIAGMNNADARPVFAVLLGRNSVDERLRGVDEHFRKRRVNLAEPNHDFILEGFESLDSLVQLTLIKRLAAHLQGINQRALDAVWMGGLFDAEDQKGDRVARGEHVDRGIFGPGQFAV